MSRDPNIVRIPPIGGLHMAECTNIELRKAREAKALTRWQLGNLLGVSESTIERWERGEVVPAPDVADLVGVSPGRERLGGGASNKTGNGLVPGVSPDAREICRKIVPMPACGRKTGNTSSKRCATLASLP